MTDLAISYRPLNTSLHIQNLQFTNAPWSNTPRKQFNKFTRPTLWNTPSTPLFEAREALHFMKHVKHVSTPSSQSTRAHQAREHVKHAI